MQHTAAIADKALERTCLLVGPCLGGPLLSYNLTPLMLSSGPRGKMMAVYTMNSYGMEYSSNPLERRPFSDVFCAPIGELLVPVPQCIDPKFSPFYCFRTVLYIKIRGYCSSSSPLYNRILYDTFFFLL